MLSFSSFLFELDPVRAKSRASLLDICCLRVPFEAFSVHGLPPEKRNGDVGPSYIAIMLA
jgi:hypothetical protein